MNKKPPKKKKQKEPVIGYCHICLNKRELTLEHIPPKSCFNKYNVREIDYLNLKNEEICGEKGRVVQGGVKKRTLCKACNNTMGKWYINPYRDFVYQLAPLANTAFGKTVYSGISINLKIRPLPVLKQIIAMFLSTHHIGFGWYNNKLRKILLDRDLNEIPKRLHFYIYSNYSHKSRFTPDEMRGTGDDKSLSIKLSEISFFPIGIIMTIEKKLPDLILGTTLHNIDFFADYKYDVEAQIELHLVNLPVETPCPAEFQLKKDEKPDIGFEPMKISNILLDFQQNPF